MPRFSPPPTFTARFCYKNKRTFLALLVCVWVFQLYMCVWVSLGSQSVSHCCCCLLRQRQHHCPFGPTISPPTFSDPPPNFSLGSCHRLGLTGKRKHNQKDNVIMPQCGTIYTKMNTTKKKKEENQHFLPVFLARPLFRPFALLLALASPLFLAPFIFCNFCCCCFFFFLFSQQTRSFIPSASFAFRFERLQMAKGWSGDS